MTRLTRICAFLLAFLSSQAQESSLEVHVVPHSVVPAGWKETHVFYYWEYVRDTLTSVVHELDQDQQKTFTWTNMHYFSMWWNVQDDIVKNMVRRLVEEERFLFADGGWVDQDNVCTSFIQILDNYYLGRSFLLKEFGKVPRVAWQMNQKGQTGVKTQFLFEMGYEALFVGNVMDNDKLQFFWEIDQTEVNGVFVQLFYDGAFRPEYFTLESDESEADMDSGERFEVQISDQILRDMKSMAESQGTRNVILPLGDIFSYYQAYQNFKLIDKIMGTIQELEPEVRIFYSTPERYLDAVKGEKEWEGLPRFRGDMVPYVDGVGNIYSGLYSSREDFKYLVQYHSQFSQASLNWFAMDLIRYYNNFEVNDQVRENLLATVLPTSYESITGTSTNKSIEWLVQEIQHDLEDTVYELQEVLQVYSDRVGLRIELYELCEYQYHEEWKCPQKDMKLTADQNDVLLVVHNPSLFYQNVPPFTSAIPNQLVSVWNSSEGNFSWVFAESYCYKNLTKEDECDVHVDMMLPPLSVEFFKIYQIPHIHYTNQVISKYVFTNDSYIENDLISIRYLHKTDTGEVHFRMKEKEMGGMEEDFFFDFRYYLGDGRAKSSGHYQLHTDELDSFPFKHFVRSIEGFRGELVDMFIIHYRTDKETIEDYFHETTQDYYVKIKLFKGAEQDSKIQFDVVFGEIPIYDEVSSELTINWHFQHNKTIPANFQTDTNQYIMSQRKVKRSKPEPQINGNLYPVGNALIAWIKDVDAYVAVMSDRMMAGTAYKHGRIEMLINRQLFQNDGLGVDELLQERDSQGRPLKSFLRFNLLFTNSQSKVLREVAQHQAMKSMGVEVYQSPSWYPKERIFYDNDHQANQREENQIFAEFLIANKVLQYQIMPKDIHGRTFNVRLVLSEEGLAALDYVSLAQKLCEYARHFEEGDPCSNKVNIAVRRMMVDGVREWEEDVQTGSSKIQVFEMAFSDKVVQI